MSLSAKLPKSLESGNWGSPYDPSETPPTEAELVADLSRLLREGLVQLDGDGEDEWPVRFAPTPRGREVQADTEKLHFENATSDVSDVSDTRP